MSASPASQRHRFYGNAALPTDRTQRPRAQYAAATSSDGGVATLRISEPIDSWGWPWGVSAADVLAVLDELPEEVSEIRVEINSPGGDAVEGMAIVNALRNHPAAVTAVVFGMAASAASVIAVSADVTVMNPGSWLMIHNAWGVEIGDANDMRVYAGFLDKISDNYADTYAASAGGTREDWRAAMDAETWYLPDEAVEAGLADRVGKADDVPAEGDAAAARARFDLSMFAHAGRDAAPAPVPPARTQTPSTEPVQGNPTRKGDADMAFTDDVRQRLGITDEAATDETVLAALDEALAEQADDTPVATTTTKLPEGVTAIETTVLDELRASAKRGEDARTQQEREDRERTVDEAIGLGKFGKARREHWLNALAKDPEGAKADIAALERGLVPVEPIGHDTPGDTPPANSLADVRESDVYKGWKL